MITDIFSRRYEHLQLRTQYFEEDRRFFNQAATMILDPLWSGYKCDNPTAHAEASLRVAHDTLALELGHEYISDRYWFQTFKVNGNDIRQAHTYSYATICKNFLIKLPPDLSEANTFIKDRISLIEIAFHQRWQQIQLANANLPKSIADTLKFETDHKRRLRVPGNRQGALRTANAQINDAFKQLSGELNERLRLAKMPLIYHNGLIQINDDDFIDARVAAPFWAIVSEPMWENVDTQMKEALDRRDRGDRTAAFHAVCALESCIKIISDKKSWTAGSENGAAQYIDNLNSKANGRFIDVWEAEILKKMFGDIRNPFAHGPAQGPMPEMKSAQTDWTIHTAMCWIRSLVGRL